MSLWAWPDSPPLVVPASQLRALPLQSARSFAAPGEVTTIGGQLVRYFSPAVLGVNGLLCNFSDPENVAYAYIVTNYVEVTGCSKFVLSGSWQMPGGSIKGLPGGAGQYGAFGFQVIPQAATYDSAGALVPPRTGTFGIACYPNVGALRKGGEDYPGPPYPAVLSEGSLGWNLGAASYSNGPMDGIAVIRLWLAGTSGGIDPVYLSLTLWASS